MPGNTWAFIGVPHWDLDPTVGTVDALQSHGDSGKELK